MRSLMLRCLFMGSLFLLFGASNANAQECCNTCCDVRLCSSVCDCGCWSYCMGCTQIINCTQCPSLTAGAGDSFALPISAHLVDVTVSDALTFLVAGRGLELTVLGDAGKRISLSVEQHSLDAVLYELEKAAGVVLLGDWRLRSNPSNSQCRPTADVPRPVLIPEPGQKLERSIASGLTNVKT